MRMEQWSELFGGCRGGFSGFLQYWMMMWTCMKVMSNLFGMRTGFVGSRPRCYHDLKKLFFPLCLCSHFLLCHTPFFSLNSHWAIDSVRLYFQATRMG